MSSTWERVSGVIAGGDLGGCYLKLSVCGEVGNVRLQMTPEGDVFRTGCSFGKALGDRTCKE